MKKLTYNLWLLVTVFIIITDIIPQENEKPYLVNPLIGDTLDLEERNYYLLFPDIDGFHYAVFYINPDSTLDANVAYFENGLLKNTFIENYKSLKSLDYHIKAKVALENINPIESLRTNKDPHLISQKGTEISVLSYYGEERVGELLAVRRNSLLMLKDDCYFNLKNLDCIWKANQSEIEQVVIEGNSYLALGIGLGLVTSAIAGALIYQSNYEEDASSNFIDFRAANAFGESFGTIILTTIGLTTLGAIIGLVTSTPDTVVDIIDENDIQGLSKYARFPFGEPKEFQAIE